MISRLDLSFLRTRSAHKRMAAIVAAFLVAGVAYALLAPRWYRSVLTIVPAKGQRGGGGLSSLLGAGDAGGLASGLLEGAGVGADVPRIAAVLQSIAVTDAVIHKFDLMKRYGERYVETTRIALWEHCAIKALPKPQLVELTCEDRDPKFVQELLSHFAEVGNQTFRRVSVSSATEEVRFLEKRVAELRTQADDSARRMREFQETHKIVDLDTQAKAVVSAIAALNSQQITKQLELEYARTFSSREEPTLRQLESQLSVMGQKVRTLEESPTAAAAQAEKPGRSVKATGLFPAALEVPRLRAELEQLYRDRKVAEAVLVFALERLEAARANEARDVSTFLVLDPPALPTKKSRPKGMQVVFIAFMLGTAVAFGHELWRTGLIAKLSGNVLGARSERAA